MITSLRQPSFSDALLAAALPAVGALVRKTAFLGARVATGGC